MGPEPTRASLVVGFKFHDITDPTGIMQRQAYVYVSTGIMLKICKISNSKDRLMFIDYQQG